MPLQASNVPQNLSKVLICVDSLQDGDISGAMKSPFLREPLAFAGILHLANRMEALFDRLAYPQAFFRFRSFREPPRRGRRPAVRPSPKEVRPYHGDELFRSSRGALGTFIVQVLLRQNATWQGTIEWVEGGKRRAFHSMLELLRLVGDALPGADQLADWNSPEDPPA